MNSKLKKIFFVLFFIIVVIVLGYLIFTIFFKPSTQIASPPDKDITDERGAGLPGSSDGGHNTINENGTGRLPGLESENNKTDEAKTSEPLEDRAPTIKANTVARGGLTSVEKLNDAPSLGLTLGSDGKKIQFYNENDGKFYKIDNNGKTEALSNKVFHNVDQVTWSHSAEKAILEYPDGSNIIYNFSEEKQITLPKHWEDFNFSSKSDDFVMKSIGLDKENQWLAISNADGTQTKAVHYIGLTKDDIYASWSPNNLSIALYTKGLDFNRQEVFFIGKNKENFKSTIIEGRGFDSSWAPSGEKLLYSVYNSNNGSKPKLWIVDAKGDEIGNNRKNINLETWANKCTFAQSDNIYCAVPEYLPEGSGIFPELAETTKDNLYKINPYTGNKKLIAKPEGSYNISQIISDEDENYLYFTDKVNQNIHKIRLK